MKSPKFRLFFRPFSPFSVKNQEKASLIHKKQALTAKKGGKTPQKIANFNPAGRKKRQKEEGESAKNRECPP